MYGGGLVFCLAICPRHTGHQSQRCFKQVITLQRRTAFAAAGCKQAYCLFDKGICIPVSGRLSQTGPGPADAAVVSSESNYNDNVITIRHGLVLSMHYAGRGLYYRHRQALVGFVTHFALGYSMLPRQSTKAVVATKPHTSEQGGMAHWSGDLERNPGPLGHRFSSQPD